MRPRKMSRGIAVIFRRGAPPRSGMCLPGSPTSPAVKIVVPDHPVPCSASPGTGVSNKRYRDAHQVRNNFFETRRGELPANDAKSYPRVTEGISKAGYRGPQQGLPGSPARITGVPDKDYRGPQQGLPGSPTRITGVPDKDYRGPRQAPSEKHLQDSGFFEWLWVPLYCSVLLFVMFCQQGGQLRGRADRP